MLDRFECYELTVQSPRHVVEFLLGVHGQHPMALREDFCGSGAVSRQWVRHGIRAGELRRAVAVDLDPEAIGRARDRAAAVSVDERIEFHVKDCVTSEVDVTDGCDVVFVGNFSIGYIQTRRELVTYLKRSRRRLELGNAGFGGGVFVCDTYGGASAFKLGGFTRRHPARGREMIEYAWSHDAADPRDAIVENSISFRILVDGEVVQEMPRAFTYRWRLWSIAELREALAEAGFAESAVYADVNVPPGGKPTPVREPAELGDDWIVMVAGVAAARQV